MVRRFRTLAVILGCGLLLAACASVPPPTEELALSEAAMSKAQDARANELAPLEFSTAREKLRQARTAMERENYVTARRLAEQAEVDANLAYFKARSTQSQQAVRELQESIETLRRELETGS